MRRLRQDGVLIPSSDNPNGSLARTAALADSLTRACGGGTASYLAPSIRRAQDGSPPTMADPPNRGSRPPMLGPQTGGAGCRKARVKVHTVANKSQRIVNPRRSDA